MRTAISTQLLSLIFLFAGVLIFTIAIMFRSQPGGGGNSPGGIQMIADIGTHGVNAVPEALVRKIVRVTLDEAGQMGRAEDRIVPRDPPVIEVRIEAKDLIRGKWVGSLVVMVCFPH